MQKFFIIFITLVAVSLLVPSHLQAKRQIPTSNTKKTANVKKSAPGAAGITAQVKFRADRRAIIATFTNLDNALTVSYSLTYTHQGVKEGAGGSLTDLSGTQTRELLFGTCSHGVCRYHSGIKNGKFIVTTKLKNGKKVGKVFQLKI